MYLISQVYGTRAHNHIRSLVFLAKIDAEQAARMRERLALLELLFREHGVRSLGDGEDGPPAWFIECDNDVELLDKVCIPAARNPVNKPGPWLIHDEGAVEKYIPITKKLGQDWPAAGAFAATEGEWRYRVVTGRLTVSSFAEFHAGRQLTSYPVYTLLLRTMIEE